MPSASEPRGGRGDRVGRQRDGTSRICPTINEAKRGRLVEERNDVGKKRKLGSLVPSGGEASIRRANTEREVHLHLVIKRCMSIQLARVGDWRYGRMTMWRFNVLLGE